MTAHCEIEPPILYLGTPVVLVSTCNGDGSPNLSPMSSAWWLGWSCMLGFDASSKTVANLRRTGECVLNLPSGDQVGQVDRLARSSGSDPLPRHKQAMGYRHVADKFGLAGLTPQPARQVRPPRVAECPIQLEAELESIRPFATNDRRMLIPAVAVELRIVAVHAAKSVLSDRFANRIDAQKWRPLLMSFLQFFARGENVHPSRLDEIPPEAFAGRQPQRRG
jgi:flavin reductase (DIM6/NTAB) family NADH-FMN oxidoreductase RutF